MARMNNVVPLRREPEPDMVWQCECGCSTHYAHLDGTLECASCGSRHADAGGAWREPLPDKADADAPSAVETTVVVSLDSPERSLKRTLGKASVQGTACVIVLNEDGGVHAWGDVPDTRKHRGWMNRKLATAKALLIRGMRCDC